MEGESGHGGARIVIDSTVDVVNSRCRQFRRLVGRPPCRQTIDPAPMLIVSHTAVGSWYHQVRSPSCPFSHATGTVVKRSLLHTTGLLVFQIFIVLAIQAPSTSQDPFSKDPFSRSGPRSQGGEKLRIQFEVSGPDDAPLAGVEIRTLGRVRPVRTNVNGEAVVEIDPSRRQSGANKPGDRIVFRAIAPDELVMPSVSTSVNFDELVKDSNVKIKMEPGVRLQGHVTGLMDREPIENLNVQAYFNRDSDVRRMYVASTDRDGHWSLVLPRIAPSVNLVIRGVKQGYRVEQDQRSKDLYARIVSLHPDQSTFEGLDFEIEQIPPVRIQVHDRSGIPVAGAQVSANVQYWADDTIGWWNSASNTESTNSDGRCELFISNPNAKAILSVSATIDGEEFHGRREVDFAADNPRNVQVVVRPLSTVSGRLFNGERPAKNVPLVLYEATKNDSGRWTSFGLRGETKTDEQGNYEFSAIYGLHYMVATKNRDKGGAQTILHRTVEQVSDTPLHLPDIDLADF